MTSPCGRTASACIRTRRAPSPWPRPCATRSSRISTRFGRVVDEFSGGPGAPRRSPMKKVMIANRGEIACRVIRSCKALGLKTVALYSEADAKAKHVAEADEAQSIGPAPAKQSYLVIDNILAAAKAAGADAVHPGYGFLAENSDFAKRVADAGMTWIGPTPDSIDDMGDKERA